MTEALEMKKQREAYKVIGVADVMLLHKDGRKPVRPWVDADVETLVVRMAEENRTWGYDRILGALANFGHDYAANTIADILKRHGIEAAHPLLEAGILPVQVRRTGGPAAR